MNKLFEEKLNMNLVTFVRVLKKYGLYTEALEKDNVFNLKLKTAPSHIYESSGGAYKGSLIEHIMLIAGYAKKLNDVLPELIRLNSESLLKVCFLHQISKALQFIENTNDFEIKKGKFFKFSDDLLSLRTGELSVYFCVEHNIVLSSDEFEAIISFDKDDTDMQVKYHSSVLSKVLKMANEFAEIERKNNFLINKK